MNNLEKTSPWQNSKAVWLNIIVMIAIGIISVVIMSIQFGEKGSTTVRETLQVVGAALLIAGASFASGGIAGFLFGIPKILQSGTPNSDQNATAKTSIVQNDNLVEISDWLTKIIVGVGLTQLYQIPAFLGRIGNSFSPIFNNDTGSKAAAICIILYFLSLGFFAIYLWTRLFFVRLLKTLTDQIQIEHELAKTELESATNQLAQIKGEIDDANQNDSHKI